MYDPAGIVTGTVWLTRDCGVVVTSGKVSVIRSVPGVKLLRSDKFGATTNRMFGVNTGGSPELPTPFTEARKSSTNNSSSVHIVENNVAAKFTLNPDERLLGPLGNM
jgi:hypothetical protein